MTFYGYDGLFLAAIAAGIGLHLYFAGWLLGLRRGARLFLVLNLSAWAGPLILWFWLALCGVDYKYDAGIDVSFSGFLHPLYFSALIDEQFGFKWFLALAIISVLGASLTCFLISMRIRREILKDSVFEKPANDSSANDK